MDLEASRSAKPGSRTVLYRFSQLLVLCTAFLLLAGAAVKTTESGLAVPDWPLSFGQVMPPMEGGVFYEHGHRMVATGVGFLTLILAGWLWLREPRDWMRRLGLVAVVLVIVQGLLGGLTVLLKLPVAVSAAHAVTAQFFFLLIVFITLALSRGWNDTSRPLSPVSSSLPWLSALTTGAIMMQLVLGAIMRHLEAALVIPDFPLVYGGLWPPAFTTEVAFHYAHRVGAVIILGLVIGTFWAMLRLPAPHRAVVMKPVSLSLVLVVAQIVMGGLIIWTERHMHPTNTHLVLGATLFATSLVITARCFRFLRSPEAHRASHPSLERATA